MAGRPKPRTVSTKQARIATLARQMPDAAIRSLSHHVDLDWMREAHRRTRKDGAVGADGKTASDFAEDLDGNLQSLIDGMKSGTYRAPPVRTTTIPKTGGKTRTLGIPTFEDKVLQRSVVMLLEPLYEQDFYDFSYGFRPGRSARDAVAALRHEIMDLRGGWVLDADVRSFFDTIDHKQLRALVNQRVADGVVKRLIGKWLRAGAVSESGITRSSAGTPQGGVISPLLANIYLHEALDRWWVQDVRPRLRGKGALIRYADDFVMVFSDARDADQTLAELQERFEQFGLNLHPEKTRIVRFQRPPLYGNEPKPQTFDFVGFTMLWERTRKGTWAVKQRTASARFSRALRTLYEWMRQARHLPIEEQAPKLAARLRGHFNYYGLPGNGNALGRFRHEALGLWKKALARRSQRGLTWRAFKRLLRQYPMPQPRVVDPRRQLRLANV